MIFLKWLISINIDKIILNLKKNSLFILLFQFLLWAIFKEEVGSVLKKNLFLSCYFYHLSGYYKHLISC